MSRVVVIGEAWGEHEEEAKAPFVGPTGRFLHAYLKQVGIPASECFFTNVFNLRPPGGDIKALCGSKTGGIKGRAPLMQGKYVRAEFAGELARLDREIEIERPNLVLALGGTAAWATLGNGKISSIRGTTYESIRGYKVLPTYHPSAIMRQWNLRMILLADLRKAADEMKFPEVVRPSREVWLEPDLNDLYRFEEQCIAPSPELSIDIETKVPQITCIGFAPRIDVALVVPFRTSQGNYWKTADDEVKAWEWVKRMCALKKAIVGQNFLYDMQHLWRTYGIPVPHATDDTMLLHHALYPEMQKGLGFLATLYTKEASWKMMRKRAEDETVKEED